MKIPSCPPQLRHFTNLVFSLVWFFFSLLLWGINVLEDMDLFEKKKEKNLKKKKKN